MRRVLDRLGWRDRTTVHGFRKTFSTWANETGAARPDVIEACLAHAESNRVRAACNLAEFATERRALLAAWARPLSPPAAPRVGLVAGGLAPGIGATTEAAEAPAQPRKDAAGTRQCGGAGAQCRAGARICHQATTMPNGTTSTGSATDSSTATASTASQYAPDSRSARPCSQSARSFMKWSLARVRA